MWKNKMCKNAFERQSIRTSLKVLDYNFKIKHLWEKSYKRIFFTFKMSLSAYSKCHKLTTFYMQYCKITKSQLTFKLQE